MKTKVAMIQDSANNGNRHYLALNKAGMVVFETDVYDCGHGASIAYKRLAQAGFEPTTAEWASKLVREHLRRKITW